MSIKHWFIFYYLIFLSRKLLLIERLLNYDTKSWQFGCEMMCAAQFFACKSSIEIKTLLVGIKQRLCVWIIDDNGSWPIESSDHANNKRNFLDTFIKGKIIKWIFFIIAIIASIPLSGTYSLLPRACILSIYDK